MKTAWITGASSGIGEALARRLATGEWRVAVSARSGEALSRLAADFPDRIVAFPLDVRNAEASAACVAAIEAALGPIDLAVLNAGTHRPLSAHDFDVAVARELIEINLLGVVHGLAPVLAAMRGRRRGHIAIVASVAGYGGLPTASAYGATKAALINLAEALKPDCDRLGIKLQVVNPGFIKTPLTDKNRFHMPFLMPVEKAVDALVAGLESSRFEITFPRLFARLVKLVNLLPYPLYFRALGRATRRTER